MNKRGQIYIIAALILSAVIFLLVSQTNFVQRILIEDDFEQLSKNFDIESAKFMNSLLAEGEMETSDMISAFETFTEEFTEYAKVENPNFEFVYVLDYKDQKIVGYYIKEDIEVSPPLIELKATVLPTTSHTVGGVGLSATLTGRGEVTEVGDISYIKVGDFQYSLEIKEGGPQIVIISREEKGKQTKVYLNEEFVKGEKVKEK